MGTRQQGFLGWKMRPSAVEDEGSRGAMATESNEKGIIGKQSQPCCQRLTPFLTNWNIKNVYIIKTTVTCGTTRK